MGGASYILAINLFIAALFALAFLLVALNNRSDRVAGWFALAYLFGIAYVLCEFLLPMQGDPALVYTLSFGAFLGALAAIVVGICRRYRQPAPWLLLGLVAAVSLSANWFAFDLGRASLLRMLAYQAPYAAMQALAALAIYLSRRRQPADFGLMALFLLSAAQFLSKPFLAQLTGGPGASSAEYMASNYALLSQSLGAVLQVATGLLMLTILVRDMLVEITARSETDMLSGVFNRRGFELRAQPLLEAAVQSGVPLTLVVADLDAFKQINDTHGHHVGDAVIAAFAGLSRQTAPDDAVIARMGGEEFAILLPGTNLSGGRLLAETIRTAFCGMPIAELPTAHFATASFGVAQFDLLESLPDMRRRADAALYQAKRSGRDRVCLATDAGVELMQMNLTQAEPMDAPGSAARFG